MSYTGLDSAEKVERYAVRLDICLRDVVHVAVDAGKVEAIYKGIVSPIAV